MTITIKEAMKKINFLQQQLSGLLNDEQLNNYTMYIDVKDKEETDYDFDAITREMDDLQNQILLIRRAVNKANQETLVGIQDYTISDSLVKIGLLNEKANRLRDLSTYKQRERSTTYNGVIEITERLYDVKIAHQQYMDTVEEIHSLQTAIDKANILTEINI